MKSILCIIVSGIAAICCECASAAYVPKAVPVNSANKRAKNEKSVSKRARDEKPSSGSKVAESATDTPAVTAGKSTPEGFIDNLDEAFKRAKEEKKRVYACFSGSDWCGWCVKLEREVFSKKEFLDAVKDDFILVFIDTPNDKNLLSEHAKTENPKLVRKYGIRGFPTALVFDAEGKEIGKTGYRRGGAAAYAEHLKAMVP